MWQEVKGYVQAVIGEWLRENCVKSNGVKWLIIYDKINFSR